MATYAVTDTQLTNIADAIRLKRDTAEEFSVDDMPLAISLIEGGGGGFELKATKAPNTDTNFMFAVFRTENTDNSPFVPSFESGVLLVKSSNADENGLRSATIVYNNRRANVFAMGFRSGLSTPIQSSCRIVEDISDPINVGNNYFSVTPTNTLEIYESELPQEIASAFII